MTSSATRRAPTARDLSRLVLARASARMVVERAHESYSDAILGAFRAEVGATVRRVSPLLLALLEHGGASIDDLAWRLRPAEGWPYRPVLPASETVFHADEASLEFPVVRRPAPVNIGCRGLGEGTGTRVAAWSLVAGGDASMPPLPRPLTGRRRRADSPNIPWVDDLEGDRMARVSNGCPAKRATMKINGMVRPAGPAAIDFTIRVDGVNKTWQLPSGTPHQAAYSAAITAMADADAVGVTHLTLQTPANLVRRQATGEWAKESPAMQQMHLLYELFKVDFDDVDWIKGPA